MGLARRCLPRRWAFGLVVVLALLASDAGAAEKRTYARSSILYVGDSLGVGTHPQLVRMLSGMPPDVDAKIGRTSSEGLTALRLRLRRWHRVVIFDLGTNDSHVSALSRNLRAAARLIGDRRLIVFTLNRPRATRFNRMVSRIAASIRTVALIHWHAIAAREDLLSSDGVHPSTRGYRRRARLIADQLALLRRRTGKPASPSGLRSGRSPTRIELPEAVAEDEGG